MSETTFEASFQAEHVEQVPETAGRPTAPEPFLERLAALEAKATEVVSLQQRIRDLEADARRTIGRERARVAILDLTGDLLEISGIPEDLDDEQLGHVNTALSRLGLETLLRTFELEVDAKFIPRSTITIQVEAESLEDATTQVENGDFDDEIKAEAGTDVADVDVEIISVESVAI